MVLDVLMGIKEIIPYQAGKVEVLLFGYFTTAEAATLFMKIDGNDWVHVRIKDLV